MKARGAEPFGEFFGVVENGETPKKSQVEAEVKSRLWSGLLKCKKASFVCAGLIALEEIVTGYSEERKPALWTVP